MVFELFGGRDSFDPPPGQRAVPTNGWKAVDELELIMRRWRATLDHSKKSEVTLGKRKADACNKHFSRLKSYLQERLPSQLVEAICNVTAEQLSPERVRTAVMECTDPDESKRSAALKARHGGAWSWCRRLAGRYRRRRLDCYQPVPLNMRPEQEGQRRAVDGARGPAAAPRLLDLAGGPHCSAQVGDDHVGLGSIRSETAMKRRLMQLRSRLPAHVAKTSHGAGSGRGERA